MKKRFEMLLFTLKIHFLFNFLPSIKSMRAPCAISLQQLRLSKNISELNVNIK